LYITQYDVIYCFHQLGPTLALGAPLGWLLCSYDMSPLICLLNTSLLFGTTRCLRLLSYFTCPVLPCQLFLQRSLRSSIKEWNL
jgi:hypothetical protein